jgi:uncharacterized protein (DUF433 family)
MKLDRITTNPAQMNGQPCIRNLRLTVRRVIELLAIYPDRSELYAEFPSLEEGDIQQSLLYAFCYPNSDSSLTTGARSIEIAKVFCSD